MSARRIVYLTFDGILTPLGFSQVVRVVTALAERGLPYTIVSIERPAHLADQDRVTAMRERLASAGVEWHPRTYDPAGTALVAGKNLAAGFAAVMRFALRRQIALVHARGYHSGLVAHAVKRLTGIPYLFDVRGYWIDERAAEGRWFVRPKIYAGAKRLERQLYSGADAIVTLTDLQAEDLRSGRGTGAPCANVTTITTVADFEQFRPADGPTAAAIPPAVRERIDGKLVVGLVGSLNGSYRADDTARLCRTVLDAGPRAHLLVLSDQRAEYEALFARHGIAADRYTLTRAGHDAMPGWLGAIDWAPLLLHENFAKRASMPTKLGEFFATGVRPVHHGCNAEVGDWVKRVGTGIVLESLDDEAFRRAAATMVATSRDPEAAARGRAIAASHFSLAAGLDKYAAILARFAPAGATVRPPVAVPGATLYDARDR